MKPKDTHPPTPGQSQSGDSEPNLPETEESATARMTRDEIRFLADAAVRPLSTTVSRYQRLNLSRRKGNAIREAITKAGLIQAAAIATRSGQVVLSELTDFGRTTCNALGIDSGHRPRESLEHRYWVRKVAEHFEKRGYEVTREHQIKGNGAIDLLAQRPGERVAVEVETGKSDIKANLAKMRGAGFDRVVLVATSAVAAGTCQNAVETVQRGRQPATELLTWLDVS